jgi:hypothetical protein
VAPIDFVLCMIALSVALVAQRVIQAYEANEARRRRKIVRMPLTPIAAARPGTSVKVAGRVEATHARGFVIRDDAGVSALIYRGSATVLSEVGGAGGDRLAVGDRVSVVGAPRPRERHDSVADARLVFAGSEAHPLYVLRRASS